MSDATADPSKKTVQVPIELLIALREAMEKYNGRDVETEAEAIVALIPKPKPRVVAVRVDTPWALSYLTRSDLQNQPDILETIATAINEYMPYTSRHLAEGLVESIAKRLGVPNE